MKNKKQNNKGINNGINPLVKSQISNGLKITAYMLYLLSFLWLWKWAKKKQFEWRKERAIGKANKLKSKKRQKYFVIQIERKFIVGTRQELRKYNKRGTKLLKSMAKSYLVNFDYRNAIIYETKNE